MNLVLSRYRRLAFGVLFVSVLISGCASHRGLFARNQAPEIVAALDVAPGNMTISRDGRMFATVHPMRRGAAQLIEITGRNTWKPYPNKAWNRAPGSTKDTLNSPLGAIIDSRDRLWVIDSGNFLRKPRAAKLVAFDIATGKLVFRLDFPQAVAPKGSFLQDLAIAPDGSFVYIADSGGTSRPGIVVVNTKRRLSYRYDSMRKFAPEDVNLEINGKVVELKGAGGKFDPARIGINPITLSDDGASLFFGSMNGTSWYAVPTALLQRRASRVEVNNAIVRIGPKPVSDGATTDAQGNHYFTSLNQNAIVRLNTEGQLQTLASDSILEWPDSVRFGPDGWLYVAVNQLNRTVFLGGSSGGGALGAGKDTGVAPYLIVRVRAGAQGAVGR